MLSRLICVVIMPLLMALSPTAVGAAGEMNGVIKGAVWSFIDINLSLSGGSYRIGAVKARFVRIEEGVREVDGHHVVGAVFRDGGDTYDMEFHVETGGGNYTVIKEVLNRKNGEPVGRVIWEEKGTRINSGSRQQIPKVHSHR